MSLSKLSLWLVRIGLFLTLAVPFLVFNSTVFPYLFGKIVFFQIIIEIIFPFFVYLAVKHPEYRPKINIIFYALGGYLVVLLISGIFGVDFLRSFWGYRERADGIFTLLHFFAFFVMLRGVFRTRREWFWFFNALLAGGLIVAADNLGFVFNAMVVAGQFVLPREGGLIGNVIFYSGFVLLEIFIALALFFELLESPRERGKTRGLPPSREDSSHDRLESPRERGKTRGSFSDGRHKKLKIFYLVCAAIFVSAVFMSLTRGAMLAAVFVGALALIFWAFRGGKKKKIIALSGIAVTVIFLGALFFARDAAFVRDNPVFSRIVSISPASGTGETRVLAWGAAVEGFKERPVLGWGYINFYVPFNKYYDPKLLSHSVGETWFDRAHNVVFEHLATTGAAGLAAYLFLLGAAVLAAWKSKDRVKQVLGFGIAAYFVQNLFAIDHPSSYLVFYIILAYLSSDVKEITAPVSPKKINFLKFVFIISAAGLSVYLIYFVNIKSFIAGKYEVRAAALSANNLQESLLWHERALSINSPWRSEAIMAFVKDVVGGVQSGALAGEEARILLEEAKNQLDAATIKRNNVSAYDYFLMGRLYSEWGRFDGAYFSKAEDAFKQALELSPRRQQIYYGYGRGKILAGRPADALPLFKKMVELNPDVAESHWYLGLEYNELGMPEAIDELLGAWALGYSLKSEGEARLMIEALAIKGRFAEIPRIYELLINLDSKNASLYAELAALYAKLGEKDRARTAAMKAMELDASFIQEGKIFLKSLEK